MQEEDIDGYLQPSTGPTSVTDRRTDREKFNSIHDALQQRPAVPKYIKLKLCVGVTPVVPITKSMQGKLGRVHRFCNQQPRRLYVLDTTS